MEQFEQFMSLFMTPQCYADSAAQDMPAQVESEIGAGKIHFDATAAAQCAGGVMFGTCAAFWTNGPAYPAACDQALVGTIADGGECVVDYDCASATSGCDPTLQVCIPSSAPRTTSRYASHVAAIFAK